MAFATPRDTPKSRHAVAESNTKIVGPVKKENLCGSFGLLGLEVFEMGSNWCSKGVNAT